MPKTVKFEVEYSGILSRDFAGTVEFTLTVDQSLAEFTADQEMDDGSLSDDEIRTHYHEYLVGACEVHADEALREHAEEEEVANYQQETVTTVECDSIVLLLDEEAKPSPSTAAVQS